MQSKATQQFFAERKQWSLDKYAILGRYLETAARILKHVWAIDLFAGPGQFATGEEGSPLLITRLAQRAESENRAYKIRGIFVERDPALYRDLREQLASFPPNLYETHEGSFTEHLGPILKHTSGHAGLFFLDPFGLEGLKWLSFSTIFDRTEPTEVLINFNVVHARRLAGFLTSPAQHREGWLAVLDEVMGDSDWRQAVEPLQAQEPADRAICKEYLIRLINKGHFRFAASYPVLDPESRTLKYFLIYATRHMKGADRMNDVMYKTFEEAQERAATVALSKGIQSDMFRTQPSPEEVRKTKVHELKEQICELAKQRGRDMTFEQIRQQLLPTWFGRVNTALFREAIRQLVIEQKIERANSVGIGDKEILHFSL